MPAETPRASDPAKGLPAVVPPSGKFIAQLFLVPFLIVTLVVCFLLTINWLVGGARSPQDFLNKLDNSNLEIRWRGAEELAQYLQRDEHLAADPVFALEVCDRLQSALLDLRALEKTLDIEKTKAPESGMVRGNVKLAEQGQSYILYLSSCLGSFVVPVGVPLLGHEVLTTETGDPKAEKQRRRWAMWNIARLGGNLEILAKLHPIERQKIVALLTEQAASGKSQRREWAEATRDYLEGPDAHSLKSLGLEKVFSHGAEDGDAFLRQETAVALSFWEGTAAENERMEELLLRLAYDNGRGEDESAATPEETGGDISVTKIPGLRICFNATIALAHRGSKRVRLGILEQMLDESFLQKNLLLKRKDGNEIPDAALILQIIQAGLQAVVDLHKRQPDLDLSSLTPVLDNLAKNPNSALRTEAARTQLALQKRE